MARTEIRDILLSIFICDHRVGSYKRSYHIRHRASALQAEGRRFDPVHFELVIKWLYLVEGFPV